VYIEFDFDNLLTYPVVSTFKGGNMRIRIVKTPPGQAPLWVREQWVGLELLIDEEATCGNHTTQRGILGGKAENLGGFSIETNHALGVLYKKSRDAAAWFVSYALLGTHLVFNRDCCQVIEE